MPIYQSQSAGVVAYKIQSGIGVPASGSGGTAMRIAGGTGGQLTKASTESNEVRSDGMRARGRHGTYKTAMSYNGEASLGAFDPIIEAVMRDTWSAPDLAITEASVLGGSAAATSITTTAGPPSTIVAAAGSWITQGLRVGDVIRLTGFATTANNSRDLRIVDLSALVITVAESLTTDATPDTSFTVTRSGKKLSQSGTLVKRYFTIDEYDVDIDLSEQFIDAVFGMARFGMAPNGLLTCDVGGIGTGQFAAGVTGTSPFLTTPTGTTGAPFSVVDATVRLGSGGGTDMVALTSLDISMDISPMAPDVFGSGNIKYSPDVFTGQMGITINFTVLRKDLQFITDFAAETVYSLQVLAVDNEAEPKNFFSIYVPNFTLGGVNKSALNKAGGPRTQTISVPPALVGFDSRGGAYARTMIAFQSTAP